MSKIIHQMVTDRIIAALDKGHIPWQKPWQRLAGVPVLPANLASKKEYNGINMLLLNAEADLKGYDLPVWMTLKQANVMGGGVKKGEASMPVIFWKQWRKPVDDDGSRRIENADAMVAGGEASAAGEEEEEFETIPVLRYYAVFNADQTFGVKPVEELQARLQKQLAARPFDSVAEAEKIFAAAQENLGCKFLERGNKAAYLPKSDMLMVPHRETFKSPAEFYLTAFHEFVHATGHKNRLKRQGFSGFTPGPVEDRKEAYAKEELVAEIGACYLANACGILSPDLFQNSTAYIQGWKNRLKEEPKLIISASSQAMRAVEFILHGRQVQEEVVENASQAAAELKDESESVKV